MGEVYQEMEYLYSKSKNEGFQVGKSLWGQIPFFTDVGKFVNQRCQDLIKEYIYCKQFNTAPYPSLYETPAKLVDDYMIIEEEYNICMNEAKQEAEKNRNK